MDFCFFTNHNLRNLEKKISKHHKRVSHSSILVVIQSEKGGNKVFKKFQTFY